MYGSIVLAEWSLIPPQVELLGETTREYTFESCGETLDMAELQEIWESKLEPVYPYRKARPATVETMINGKLNAPAARQDRCGKAQGDHPRVPRHQL